MSRKATYEILDGERWITCKKAEILTRLGQQFLRYELSDRTIGLKRPGTWRRIEPAQPKQEQAPAAP